MTYPNLFPLQSNLADLSPGLFAQYEYYNKFCSFVNGQFTGSTSWNFGMFDSLYRTSWVAEKCVTVLADDMTDKWRVFEHDDPEVIKIRQAYEEENQIADKVREVQVGARLYGGSSLVPILDGQFNDEAFKTPFNPQSVQKDDLKGFQILTKFDLEPVAGINRDIFVDPRLFGDYIYYKIIRIQTFIDASVGVVSQEPVNSANLPTIHTSRMIKFYGKELLYYQKFFNGGWGDSILTPLLDKIPAIEEAFYLIYLYLDLFNVDEIKIQNLSAAMKSDAGDALFKKYKIFRDKMRSSKLRFMDANDTMNRNELSSIANITPVFQSLLQFVVGATGIPITRILGTSVGGWSTGDNELTQYYDLVAQNQNRIRAQLKVMDEIIERSIWGKKMDIKYRFLPKKQPTEKELAEIKSINAQTFQTYIQNRVMTPKVVAENIKQEFQGMDPKYILTLDEDFIDYESNTTLDEYEDGEEDVKTSAEEKKLESLPPKSEEEKEEKGADPEVPQGD